MKDSISMHIIVLNIPKYIGLRQVWTCVPIRRIQIYALADDIAPDMAETTPSE